MATYNKFNDFVEKLNDGEHDASADQFAVALTNTLPVATNSVLTDITEITYTNLSSRNLTTASHAESGGTFTLDFSDLVLTSSGGTTGPFRYVVIYNDTEATDGLVAWFDYGSALTLQDGETLTLTFGANFYTVA